MRRSLILVIAMMFFVAACSDDAPAAEPVADAPTAGPIIFKADIDSSASPVVGTFDVTSGADVLGCSSGTLERTTLTEYTFSDVMTCESGSKTGTFTTQHSFSGLFDWDVQSSSDDFVGLQGEGSWVFVKTGTSSTVETNTGDIKYTP